MMMQRQKMIKHENVMHQDENEGNQIEDGSRDKNYGKYGKI
jgi:hypothetical protein